MFPSVVKNIKKLALKKTKAISNLCERQTYGEFSSVIILRQVLTKPNHFCPEIIQQMCDVRHADLINITSTACQS